jgi:type I restriction enzyme S subunit
VIDISAGHLEIVKKILAETVPDAKVFVFGSRATGIAKKHSDLDLALKGSAVVDKKILRSLAVAFEESDLPFRVDIIDLNATKENFRTIIEKQAVPIDE